MPYYSWSGIDLKGQMHKGRLFARSRQELDAILLKQEIAVLRCKQARSYIVFKAISLADKIEFFRQLGQMLGSGVLMPDALVIIGAQTQHPKFQDIIIAIAHDVMQGSSLSQALAKHSNVFDTVMMHMVAVGQESGKLSLALAMLTSYLQTIHDFNKKVRSALFVPACTFVFFLLVTVLIFTLIIPQFAGIFSSVHQELPTITKQMIRISGMMRSGFAAAALCVAIAIGILLHRWTQISRGKRIWDTFILGMPFIGTLIRQRSLAYFLEAVGMLLQGGMQLVPALKIAKETVHNAVLHSHLVMIEKEVEDGSSLSQAMMHDPGQIFSASTVAVIRVAEESGMLSTLLVRSAQTYQEQVQRTLAFITLMINPLLMIILGLLITMLIFAVYLPIINLSNVLGG